MVDEFIDHSFPSENVLSITSKPLDNILQMHLVVAFGRGPGWKFTWNAPLYILRNGSFFLVAGLINLSSANFTD
jgi:hypothetical protein